MIKYAREQSLFYFEVSALNNQGISNMMYSVIAELPICDEDNNVDKKQIAADLEAYNQPNVNISVISNLDVNKEDIINENNKNKTNKAFNNNNNNININSHNNGNKKDKRKCC